MDRRSFLKSIAATVAACALPASVVSAVSSRQDGLDALRLAKTGVLTPIQLLSGVMLRLDEKLTETSIKQIMLSLQDSERGISMKQLDKAQILTCFSEIPSEFLLKGSIPDFDREIFKPVAERITQGVIDRFGDRSELVCFKAPRVKYLSSSHLHSDALSLRLLNDSDPDYPDMSSIRVDFMVADRGQIAL